VFVFEVEYLLGRAFAGDFRDRSEPEWPPHPSRLFSALAAAYFENGAIEAERRALAWLERQRPPQIRAGEPGAPVLTTAYVPPNFASDPIPALRRKQPRYFPAQGPSDATVYFIWPEAQPEPEVTAALDALAARAAYLGRACSMVRMCVTGSAPEPNYIPDAAGEHVLRIPNEGRLQELEYLFAAGRRPSPGAQQRYARLDRPKADPPPIESEFGHMAIFKKAAGPGLPIEAALTLTDAVRTALLSAAGQNGPIAEIIHGHHGGTHCAIAALPFAGWENADGHLMGFAVVWPRRAGPAQRRSILAACYSLEENGVHIPGIGDWRLEAVDLPLARTLRAETWARPARRWSSVTPILLDRFPKTKGPSVEDILTAGCRRIGLPAPQAIGHGPYSHLKGVPPVPAFRLRRKGDPRPRWGVHATLDFPVPVVGPVLLGAGRYFGLGLLMPEVRDE
jgi:CRISPR-associated protein Csb2